MNFTKMHGAGNDFIIINNMIEKLPGEKFPEIASRLCSRRTSIGADGIMFVDQSHGEGDYRMHFFNADGSEGEMCGNGARCISRYGFEKGLASEHQLVETKAGLVEGWKIDQRNYRIKLNSPTKYQEDMELTVKGITYTCTYVELGNPGLPHLVVNLEWFDKLTGEELYDLGKALRSHQSLKNGANVNFYYIDQGKVYAKTFERGVEDFTLACGTGAGSIGYTLYKKGVIENNQALISMPGGILNIEVMASEKDGQTADDIYLVGPTNIVAEGFVLDEDFIL